MLLNSFMTLLIIIGRCEARSITFVVKHEEFFAVDDDKEQGHIPLSETHERLFELTDTSNNADNNQDSGTADSKATVGANKAHDLHENPVHDYLDKENENYSENDADEDDVYSTSLEDFHDIDDHSRYNDVTDSEHNIESVSGLQKIFRKKRSAREQWRNSLPGAKPGKSDEEEPDIWEEVSDDEIRRAQLNTYKQAAEYAGWTLLSVAFFVFVGICFLRDPVACIFAFGTGCPCCLICCPCIRAFTDKYLDSKKIVREQTNKYMPGIIVNDDGTIDHYDPTPDELDALVELMSEFEE
ncbi:uncharacterized protein LOC132718383 [Ruditapes philippinarum]|uniref:uncharacterized protein LOC132718383 n=1 Tax=Ruditapes philippinarum TaxID=129788 RepID=UPI00295C0CC4|nr:uncharacterized protein LOC132718383 [Ruditapes philippinarum]